MLVGLGLAGCSPLAWRPASRVAASAWSLATVDGDTVRSESLRGKVVVLAWLDPACPAVQDASESGVLRALERRWMSDSRVEILYVASMAGQGGDWLAPGDWKPWLKEARLRGTVLIDSSQTLAKSWGIPRLPSAGIVDTAGMVRWGGRMDLVDTTGEPAVSKAVAAILEGSEPWAPRLEPAGGCPISYRP